MSIDVKVKLAPGAAMPEYKTAGAAGMDLAASSDSDVLWSIGAGGRCMISTGVSLEIPPGYEAQVRPRSGLARDRGLVAVIGTIDSDYRGEVGVTLVNLSDTHQWVKPGDRIAQIVFAPVVRANLVQVDELGETERGAGGFGSTGAR